MRGFDVVFSAVRLIAKSVKGLSLKAEVTLGLFLRLLGFSETAQTSDSHTVNVQKREADQGTFVDSQIIVTGLVKAENPVATDAIAASLITSRSDSFAVSDRNILEAIKVNSDSGAFVDSSKIDTIKALSDLATATDDVNGAALGDDQIITLFKPIANQSSVSELAAKLIAKSFADSTTVSDVLQSQVIFENQEIEAPSLSDDFAFVVSKNLAELPSASDNAALLFARPNIADAGNLVDSAVKLVNVNPSDNGGSADSGSLKSQGYCDFTYFADDYVGASRTF